MEESDPFFLNSVGNSIYERWDSYCENIDINNFKTHPNILYMTEHDESVIYAKSWENIIKNYCEKLNICENDMYECMMKNEIYGNSKKNCYGMYNSNSLKYLYMSLIFADHLKKIDDVQIDIIEIGGGYGGFAVIFYYVCQKIGININSYTLIDLKNVIKVQNKYINANVENTNIFKFYDNENYINNINNEKKYILFSSYSLSEIPSSDRLSYIDNLNLSQGLIFWNISFIDLPEKMQLIVKNEEPQTGKYNKIIWFINQ